MLTPKLQDAVQLAGTAADHTLNRCRGGWFSRSATASPHGAQVVTTRTANALVALGLATYNSAIIHSALTLTPAGIAEAARAQPMRAAA
ncbi:MAG: hypothetical protein JSS57_17560 [Proteobacteria bacterium]|nr:hypothetical protein [Pseudomonadota bacterium]